MEPGTEHFRGVLGQFGIGRRMLLGDSVGVGKTVEAGLIAAEMVRGARSPRMSYGVGRPGLGVKQLLDLAGSATTPDETVLRAEPFARRRMRAKTVSRRARYVELRRRAEVREENGRDQDRASTTREHRVRDGGAREAVLLRSEGQCESPDCLLPALPYRTKAGQPLLEIDHIDDHAAGGRDHPSAMIALCPNCHANKTHGADGAALRERLRVVAKALDADLALEEHEGEQPPSPTGDAHPATVPMDTPEGAAAHPNATPR
ncbi:MAG TPA: HNH endonuclease [Streptomyces sp.]